MSRPGKCPWCSSATVVPKGKFSRSNENRKNLVFFLATPQTAAFHRRADLPQTPGRIQKSKRRGMFGCFSSPLLRPPPPRSFCSLVRHRAEIWERDQKSRQRLLFALSPLSRF